MKLNKELLEVLKEIKVSKSAIQLIEETNTFELLLDEKNIIKIKILNQDLAYEMYCQDLLADEKQEEINFLDVIYSGESEDSYARSYKCSSRFSETMLSNNFDHTSIRHAMQLVCYLFVRVNEFKYSKLQSIEDVVEPIPFQIFVNLLNKSHDKLDVFTEINGTVFAGEFDEIELEKTMAGIKVNAYINILSKGKDNYVVNHVTKEVIPSSFVRSIEDLGLSLLTDEMRAELTKKGRHYVNITKEPKYCECHGDAFTPGWMGDIRHRIDSRVMIDIASFRLLNPEIANNWYTGSMFYGDSIVIGDDVPEDLLWMCSPVVYGFSFTNKIWCKMYTDDIIETTFSDNAFNDLIIPEEYKDLFVAALTNDIPSLDSIAGKGAGKIFLLYGAPGVGK